MGETASAGSAACYRELPPPIALEDTVETHASAEPPDPTMGRDTESEFLLRHAE